MDNTDQLVACSCFDISTSFQDDRILNLADVDILRLNGYQKLHDTYFCTYCKEIKCPKCRRYEIQKKYCINCLEVYNDGHSTRCTNSCFSCPVCSSPLDISFETLSFNDDKGRQFSFKCVYCDYSYLSGIITKPKPIFKIIRDEFLADRNHENNVRKLRNHIDSTICYHALKENLASHNKVPSLGSDTLYRFKSLQLNGLIHLQEKNENKLVTLEETVSQDKIQLFDTKADKEGVKYMTKLRTMESLINIESPTGMVSSQNEKVSSERGISGPRLAHIQIPIQNKLVSVPKVSCSTCQNPLLEFGDEVPNSRLKEVYSASDYLPSITTKHLKLNGKFKYIDTCWDAFVLEFKNPHNSDVRLSIDLRSNFVYDSDKNASAVKFILSKKDFTIGGRSAKRDRVNVLSEIPPNDLVCEIIENSKDINNSDISNLSAEVLRVLNKAILRKGPSWCQIPLIIIYESRIKKNQTFYVPLQLRAKSTFESSQATKNHNENINNIHELNYNAILRFTTKNI